MTEVRATPVHAVRIDVQEHFLAVLPAQAAEALGVFLREARDVLARDEEAYATVGASGWPDAVAARVRQDDAVVGVPSARGEMQARATLDAAGEARLSRALLMAARRAGPPAAEAPELAGPACRPSVTTQAGSVTVRCGNHANATLPVQAMRRCLPYLHALAPHAAWGAFTLSLASEHPGEPRVSVTLSADAGPGGPHDLTLAPGCVEAVVTAARLVLSTRR